MGAFMSFDDDYILEQTTGDGRGAPRPKNRYVADNVLVLAADERSFTMEFVTSKGEAVGVTCAAPTMRQLHARIAELLTHRQ